MKIDIALQQTSNDSKITDQIVRKTRLALGRFSSVIQIIRISLTDLNGAKDGIDIRCVVKIKLASSGEIIVQGIGNDIFSALNSCLPRASRTIVRSLERKRETALRMIQRKKLDFYKNE